MFYAFATGRNKIEKGQKNIPQYNKRTNFDSIYNPDGNENEMEIEIRLNDGDKDENRYLQCI